MSDEADLLVQDDAARERALDITRSFLVQAPAGSGKTELLIQRLLALLARVDEPERILALTFTRKAAGEMRERVLRELIAATQGDPVAAEAPHAQVTRRLALAALAADRARGWALTEHPARLRIATFDALTTWIVRSAPLSAMLGPSPTYTEDAAGLYEEAAADALVRADAHDAHWQRLLVHMHNDAGQVAKLVARLLARRDQLLRQIGVGDAAAVREALRVALEDEANAALAALARAFPPDLASEIEWLARWAARELTKDVASAELAAGLSACADCGGLPAGNLGALPHWRTLARWLLTKRGTPLATVDKRHGFPAPGKDAAKAHAKHAMEALVARIAAVPGLAQTLHGVGTMPAPASIDPRAWEVVEALLHVVPRAAAELAIVFARSGEVDFIQAAIAALDALGTGDAPSDLLQRLDYRLAHLLVDEFQDTSATQLELLRRLTAGWTPGEDGRTIFAVGDPMQSIYRFREAEVRLFVEAQLARDVAGVPVERLTLRRNFRSQRRIVEWVNATFPAVLGRVSDPTRGAVAYEAATAAKPPLANAGVTFDCHADGRDEARSVVARVREAITAGSTDIAILVRARAHLDEILPQLRAAGIAFAAVELDKLGQRQAVQDLTSLAHALLQPGDRLAWLAVLRAPWCGLAFADLLAIAEAAPPPASIVTALDDPAVLRTLSAPARARLGRVAPILLGALATQGRASVGARVRGAWLALGGPACLTEELDLDAAQRWFEVLAEHERAGDVPDWSVFCAALDELRASSPPASGVAVKVMTMHKAKGLQFDTVILPGLGHKGRGASHELLRWRSRERGLLIAPAKSPGAAADPLYDYLKRLEVEETSAELGRLLYVACTRAQSRLHLCAVAGVDEGEDGALAWRPVPSSLLAKLWSALQAMASPPGSQGADAAQHAAAPSLLRLPAAYVPRRSVDGLPALTATVFVREDVAFDWAQQRARAIGTLAHRLLARIAAGGPRDDAGIAALAPRVRADLTSAGFAPDEVDGATKLVLEAIRRTLADARGRWLFEAAHEEARSEWGLAGVDNGAIVHVVLDRTFIAEGARWIVDFKTGTHEGGDVAGFLASEAERYRPQLQRYGRLARALDPRPVRLALFYPLIDGGFVEIAPD